MKIHVKLILLCGMVVGILAVNFLLSQQIVVYEYHDGYNIMNGRATVLYSDMMCEFYGYEKGVPIEIYTSDLQDLLYDANKIWTDPNGVAHAIPSDYTIISYEFGMWTIHRWYTATLLTWFISPLWQFHSECVKTYDINGTPLYLYVTINYNGTLNPVNDVKSTIYADGKACEVHTLKQAEFKSITTYDCGVPVTIIATCNNGMFNQTVIPNTDNWGHFTLFWNIPDSVNIMVDK